MLHSIIIPVDARLHADAHAYNFEQYMRFSVLKVLVFVILFESKRLKVDLEVDKRHGLQRFLQLVERCQMQWSSREF